MKRRVLQLIATGFLLGSTSACLLRPAVAPFTHTACWFLKWGLMSGENLQPGQGALFRILATEEFGSSIDEIARRDTAGKYVNAYEKLAYFSVNATALYRVLVTAFLDPRQGRRGVLHRPNTPPGKNNVLDRQYVLLQNFRVGLPADLSAWNGTKAFPAYLSNGAHKVEMKMPGKDWKVIGTQADIGHNDHYIRCYDRDEFELNSDPDKQPEIRITYHQNGRIGEQDISSVFMLGIYAPNFYDPTKKECGMRVTVPSSQGAAFFSGLSLKNALTAIGGIIRHSAEVKKLNACG